MSKLSLNDPFSQQFSRNPNSKKSTHSRSWALSYLWGTPALSSFFQMALMRSGFSGWYSWSGVWCLHIFSSYKSPTRLCSFLLLSLSLLCSAIIDLSLSSVTAREEREKNRSQSPQKWRSQFQKYKFFFFKYDVFGGLLLSSFPRFLRSLR